MRINVYAEELTTEVEIVSKSPENLPGETFYGVRLWLHSPNELHYGDDDDDRSAVTLWVPWTKARGCDFDYLAGILLKMAQAVLETEKKARSIA